jgi:hypothetical protein
MHIGHFGDCLSLTLVTGIARIAMLLLVRKLITDLPVQALRRDESFKVGFPVRPIKKTVWMADT